RADRDREIIAAAGAVDHVGEQERAARALGEAALELPAHQGMQLGVLVDRTVDAHEQTARLERGEMGLEIEPRGAAGGSGSARARADVEHGLSDCIATLPVYRLVPRCAIPGVARAWARSSSAPASRAWRIPRCSPGAAASSTTSDCPARSTPASYAVRIRM